MIEETNTGADSKEIELNLRTFSMTNATDGLGGVVGSCYSIGDGLQYCVDFVGHLALLLFEIGFKLSLRIVVEGTVWDQTVGLEPVSPRLFCSGLKVDNLPSASSVREDAYSTKACSGSSMQY
ncbi:hypothetical protein Tco_1136599 [Tanacetum coccineum]